MDELVFFEHERVVSGTQKNFRARDAVECSNVFLSAGNNSGVLKTVVTMSINVISPC